MNGRRQLAALAALAALASATPASAITKYYSRQTLGKVSVAAQTPPTTPTAPTTPTPSNNSVCGALTGGGQTTSQWVQGGTIYKTLASASSTDQALSECNASIASTSFVGFCSWNNNSNIHGPVYLWTGGSQYTLVPSGNTTGYNLYASACAPK